MHTIERLPEPNERKKVENNRYTLLNQDSKYLNIKDLNFYIITEAPNLSKEYIEDTLDHLNVRTSYIFCDYELNLKFPTVQFKWDHYRKRRNYLIPYLIDGYTIPGNYILDPFAGYGYIGEVALSLRRRYIGCEIKTDIYERLVENIQRCTI